MSNENAKNKYCGECGEELTHEEINHGLGVLCSSCRAGGDTCPKCGSKRWFFDGDTYTCLDCYHCE